MPHTIKSKPRAKRLVTLMADAKGYITHYKSCSAPEAHRLVTYSRDFECYGDKRFNASVCDICNESPDWLLENLWRYSLKSQQVICTFLNVPMPHMPRMPIAATVTLVEAPVATKSSIVTPETLEPSQQLQDIVVEHCLKCNEIAEFVGYDGESLCKQHWQEMLEVA